MACKYQRLLVGFCLWSVQYETEDRRIVCLKYIQWWKKCSGQLMHLGCKSASAVYVSAVTYIYQHVAQALFHPAGWFGKMTSKQHIQTARSVKEIISIACVPLTQPNIWNGARKIPANDNNWYWPKTFFPATVCNNTVTTLTSRPPV